MGIRPRLALALGSALVVGAAARAQDVGASLDASTRARLERSELVAEPLNEQRGPLRLFGGTSMKVLDASADEVWLAIERAPDLGELLPGNTTVQETSRAGAERAARVRHVQGPIEATYHVRITFDERRRLVVFRLDTERESSIRAGWGFVQVSPWPGGRALVRTGALVDVGTGLVTGLMRPALQRAILDAPTSIERYVARCEAERARC